MRRRSDLPKSVMLPSGRVVLLSEKSPPREVSRRAGLFADAVHCIETRLTMKDEKGERVHVGGLVLADFNALRAILARIGWLEEEEVTIECVNCNKELRVRPCETFELGPFVDRELEKIDVAAHDGVRLEPRTVAQAGAFHEALARGPIAFTKRIVKSMGVQEIRGERDSLQIARILRDCDDETFTTVTDAFLRLAYPPQLVAVHVCPSCGARNDVDAPWAREFPYGPAPRARDAPFPSFEEFDREARKIGQELVPADVVLVVEGGVAACDDGGVPLLGSYVPPFEGSQDAPSRAGEITVYYRTFRAMHEDDGPYDWQAELRETIEHELEHHLHHLGDDPMDEAERQEIVREAIRIVGRREMVRREARSLLRDVSEFARRTWPIWIGLLILAVFWSVCGNSRV